MLNVETLLQAKKFRVERRAFDVNGQHLVHDIVVHPGAAVILPIMPDGRLAMIYNYRVAAGGELLELPAGTLDPGEDPLTCAGRELAEETGYRAGRIVPLISFYSSPGIVSERLHAFLATELTPGETAHEGTEQIRLAPLTLEDTLRAIHDGRICDGKTIVALLFYERFVRGMGGAA
jgi:ADP-ribose pyrophosphatase